uniref:TNFR-Cys domain-containing protein n=1 Tax=Clastoptera arizonana TaxID=38151 RepID=A0A1B6DT35_9HEMI
MGWRTNCILIYCVLIVFVSARYEECGNLKSCVKCEQVNSTDAEAVRCIKCRQLIVLESRQCVESCPPGYSEEWSSLVDYMGRVCRESLFLGGIALSGQTLAVVVGALAGTVICICLVFITGICIKYRRFRALRAKARQSPSLGHLTGTQRSQDSDDSERPEFLKHLASLRSEAPIFLAMLNETRKQVRDLRRPNRGDSAIQAYKPVLKDLSRILILLNRREERIGNPPADWETLLAWGERVLRRYKKHNPNQVAQLVSFLQVPVQTHPSPPPSTASPYPSQLTTFSPNNKTHLPHTDSSSTGTTPSPVAMVSPRTTLQQLAISAFDNNYSNKHDDDLRRSNAAMFQQSSLIDSGVDFSSNWDFNPQNYTILAEWTATENEPTDYGEFMTEEDDFFQLGFRPQDEITTEL